MKTYRKEQQKNKAVSLPSNEQKQQASLASLRLSPGFFYGAFVSLSIFLTILLYGNSMQVAHMEIHFPEQDAEQQLLQNRMARLVTGYPIEHMTEAIAKEDSTTAAFLIAIGKKESNWGKRVPRDAEGRDCYNYWGYRGAGSRGIAMGHGCFGSPEEAIGIVGGRLSTLIHEYQFRTAAEMVVWKCGWSCDGHSNQSVKKWIADVGYYVGKIEKQKTHTR